MSQDSSTLTAIKKELGAALPDTLALYAKKDEELFKAYLTWRSSILDNGIIPRNQKLLMIIALLTAQKDVEPLRIYASAARDAGVSAQELKEALKVGIQFSGGAGVVAASHVADLLDD